MISKRSKREGAINFLFVLPSLLFFLTFIVYPIVDTFYLSLFEWDGLSPVKDFVGLRNYLDVFTKDKIFYLVMRNNLYWAVLAITIQLVLGFFLALILNQKIRGRIIYRTVFFLPLPISAVVIAFTWGWIYNPTYGYLNNFLKTINLGRFTRNWLGDPRLAIFMAIVVNIWRWTGFSMVLYLAGLQTIPEELYEAAVIDGAGWWDRTRYITIPLLSSITWTLIILGIIGTLKEFELIYILTEGGPFHYSELISVTLFKRAFVLHKVGAASVIGVIVFLMALIITIVQLWYLQKYKEVKL